MPSRSSAATRLACIGVARRLTYANCERSCDNRSFSSSRDFFVQSSKASHNTAAVFPGSVISVGTA